MTRKPLSKEIFLSVCLIFSAYLLQAQTFITSDSVSGTWFAASSPYVITRNILVPSNAALKIEAGTEIQFAGNYALKVEGTLVATGKENEIIRFRYADSSMIDLCKPLCDSTARKIDGWKGLRFLENRPENDTSILAYCSVSGAKALEGTSAECTGGAFDISGPGLVIVKNCSISNNQGHLGGAMYFNGSNPIIDGNLIEQNQSISNGGAFFIYNSKPVIKNNLIRLNTSPEFGGAFYINESEVFFINNTIAENDARFGGAISMDNNLIYMINNTIANNEALYNGGGLHCIQTSPYILNSILWGNTCGSLGKQIYLYKQAYPEITYSNIQGGLAAIEMFSDTLNLVRQYSQNLEEDPMFIINDVSYFSLDEGSPCIDAGMNNDTLVTEALDMNGNPRIINDIIDMGAQEFSGLNSNIEVERWDEKENPTDDKELILYPNPNQGRFRVKINAIGNELLQLNILNVEGQILYAERICTDGRSLNVFLDLNIPRGFYYLELNNSKGDLLKRGKLIVQ